MDAPLLIQLADRAAEQSTDPDTPFLERLRSDAFTIRLSALAGLVQHVIRRSNAAA